MNQRDSRRPSDEDAEYTDMEMPDGSVRPGDDEPEGEYTDADRSEE